RQVARQHDPHQQRLQRRRPRQAGPGRRDHRGSGRARSRRDRTLSPARRDLGRRTLYPKGKESDEVYEPGVFYCKDAFQGLDTMDALVDAEARAALIERIRGEARQLREKPVVVDDGPPTTDDSVRSKTATDVEIPTPPF